MIWVIGFGFGLVGLRIIGWIRHVCGAQRRGQRLPAEVVLLLGAAAVTLVLLPCRHDQSAVSAEQAPRSDASAPKKEPSAAATEGFKDDWKRANGPLGNGWHSAHDDHRNWWDPLELHDGTPVNTNPDKGRIVQPDNSGGRAAAYQDFGPDYADNFTIGTWWNGKHHAPGFAIACINLETPDWGLAFCYEPQIAGGVYVLWAMGRRPNQIRVVKSAPGGDHVDGTPMFLEMRVQSDTVACLADGKEILTSSIPAALVGATTHGFGLDVNPVPGRPPNVQVISGPFVIAPLKP